MLVFANEGDDGEDEGEDGADEGEDNAKKKQKSSGRFGVATRSETRRLKKSFN